MNKKELLFTMLSAIFVVLIIVGSYISVTIPLSPVPIVLQNMFVFAAALLLGKKWGTTTIIAYLIMGAVGLPVFANGMSQAALFGPTGGYLVGYIPAVFVAGLISEKGNGKLLYNSIAVISAVIIVYLVGVPWLKFNLDKSFIDSIKIGFLPFILWDIIKAISVILLVQILNPLLDSIKDA